MQYIVVYQDSFTIDTDEEREQAVRAMQVGGFKRAAIFVGDPEDPSSYFSGTYLIAPDEDDLDIPELGAIFFADAILTRPGEGLIETVQSARSDT
jgi:hypothetical protein